VPILIIGNHYLEGKRVALKKPLAIINKDDESSPAGEAESIDYQLTGVIRFKYIFKNRPKPL
jgi:chromosome transmission fidelity protein 8